MLRQHPVRIQDDAWWVRPGTPPAAGDVQRLGCRSSGSRCFGRDRPSTGRGMRPSPRDRAYDWRRPDRVLRGLRRHGLTPVLTLVGTPAWANGGRSPSFAPPRPRDFRRFATAAARRYPWVRHWLIWNEPNKRLWLRPTKPGIYVQHLLIQLQAIPSRAAARARRRWRTGPKAARLCFTIVCCVPCWPPGEIDASPPSDPSTPSNRRRARLQELPLIKRDASEAPHPRPALLGGVEAVWLPIRLPDDPPTRSGGDAQRQATNLASPRCGVAASTRHMLIQYLSATSPCSPLPDRLVFADDAELSLRLQAALRTDLRRGLSDRLGPIRDGREGGRPTLEVAAGTGTVGRPGDDLPRRLHGLFDQPGDSSGSVVNQQRSRASADP